MAPPLVSFVRGGILTANTDDGLSDPIGAAMGNGKMSKAKKNGIGKINNGGSKSKGKSRACAEGDKCKAGGVIGGKQHTLHCTDCDSYYHRICKPTMTPKEYSNSKKSWSCGCRDGQLSSQPDLSLNLTFFNNSNDDKSGTNKDSFPSYQSEIDFNSMKGQKLGH